jgi:hypothetical protein
MNTCKKKRVVAIISLLLMAAVIIITRGNESREVSESPDWLNKVCKSNNDCGNISEMTSCYYECADENECKTAKRCNVGKKSNIGPDCAFAKPCKPPATVRCVNSKCKGTW